MEKNKYKFKSIFTKGYYLESVVKEMFLLTSSKNNLTKLKAHFKEKKFKFNLLFNYFLISFCLKFDKFDEFEDHLFLIDFDTYTKNKDKLKKRNKIVYKSINFPYCIIEDNVVIFEECGKCENKTIDDLFNICKENLNLTLEDKKIEEIYGNFGMDGSSYKGQSSTLVGGEITYLMDKRFKAALDEDQKNFILKKKIKNYKEILKIECEIEDPLD